MVNHNKVVYIRQLTVILKILDIKFFQVIQTAYVTVFLAHFSIGC